MQKKWKSLRDCFHKYVSNPHKSKRPYLYSKQLQFLLKDNKLPKRSSGPTKGEESEEDGAEEIKPRWKPRKKLKLSKHDDPSDEEEIIFDGQDNDSDEFSATEPNTSSKGTANNETSSHGQFAFANVDSFMKDNNDDPDKMFLMSLLPHLKSIPEEFRLNAKMELMQVLQQANHSISKLI